MWRGTTLPFLVMIPCSLESGDQHFGITCSLCDQCRISNKHWCHLPVYKMRFPDHNLGPIMVRLVIWLTYSRKSTVPDRQRDIGLYISFYLRHSRHTELYIWTQKPEAGSVYMWNSSVCYTYKPKVELQNNLNYDLWTVGLICLLTATLTGFFLFSLSCRQTQRGLL
jgi:hypothetical protein